jgi:hypothetical protein
MIAGTEAYIRKQGVQVSRPGNERNGRYAISFYKFKAFLKQFKQVNGELKNLPKGEPWLNCVGLVDLQPDKSGNLKVVRKAIAVYVWDTKKVVGIIQIPDGWYLQNPHDSEDRQDFESIFVTSLKISWITVADPEPGPFITKF